MPAMPSNIVIQNIGLPDFTVFTQSELLNRGKISLVIRLNGMTAAAIPAMASIFIFLQAAAIYEL